MWFDIIGGTLAFLSSIIFSAGLIKPREQIRDENATYFDENSFTMDSEMTSQPYFIAAFGLMIAGFATVLGGQLGQMWTEGKVLPSVLFAVSITAVGYLGTALLFIRKTNAHTRRKTAFRKRIFLNAARTYLSELRGFAEMNAKPNAEYKERKEMYQKDLLEKAQQIKEPDNEQEIWLIQEMDAATSPRLLVEALTAYVDSAEDIFKTR